MPRLLFGALLMLGACASPETLPHSPRGVAEVAMAPPELVVSDGTVLAARHWMPPQGREPERVVLAVHGYNDYSAAFSGVGAYLSEEGAAVYAYDQRGYGGHPGRGIWPGEANLIHDLRDALRAVAARHPGLPLYVLGESMGGAITVLALQRGLAPDLAGIVLVAPALWGGEHMSWWYRAPLWLAAHTRPQATMTGSSLQVWPSDNQAMLQQMSADAHVLHQSRVDAIYGITQLMRRAYELPAPEDTPTLLLYGAHDEVIPKRPILSVFKRWQENPQVRLAYYAEGYHMLTRDLQADRVYADIGQWLRTPEAALPSGADHESTARLQADQHKTRWFHP